MAHRGQPRFVSRRDRVLAGVKRVQLVASPVAGADWTITVPGGREWRLDTFRAVLATSAVVANRFPSLQLSDGSTPYWEAGQQTALVASGSYRLSGSVGGPQAGAGGPSAAVLITLPDVWLPGAHVFSVTTAGIDAGDQWSAVALFVEERFIDDQTLSNHHLAHEAREQAERDQGQPTTMRY